MSAHAIDASSRCYEVIGQGDDGDWHARRASGIGASEAAIMLGVSPRYGEGGPAVLWSWKTGRQEPDDLDEIEAIRWGHIMEPVIVETYSTPRYANRQVRKTREHLRHLEHRWALATLDAWTLHPVHGWIPFEAKNVGSYQAERWVDGVPVEMWWQLHQQMLVTGAACASIAACVGGNALWWEDVERDEVAIAKLIARGGEFWRCVEADRVPLHVPTLLSVKALYPAGAESGRAQLAGEEWVELDARLLEIKRVQSELQKERDHLEAKVKDAIGAHAEALLPNGVTFTHKTQTRAEVTVSATSFRVLRRKAPKEI